MGFETMGPTTVSDLNGTEDLLRSHSLPSKRLDRATALYRSVDETGHDPASERGGGMRTSPSAQSREQQRRICVYHATSAGRLAASLHPCRRS